MINATIAIFGTVGELVCEHLWQIAIVAVPGSIVVAIAAAYII